MELTRDREALRPRPGSCTDTRLRPEREHTAMAEARRLPRTLSDHSRTSVGTRELSELQTQWEEYSCLVEDLKKNRVMDPVAALRQTGAVLKAVNDVLMSGAIVDG